jgi:hypothetical protein
MKKYLILLLVLFSFKPLLCAQNSLSYAWAHSPLDARGNTLAVKISAKNDIYYGGFYAGGNPCDLNPSAATISFTETGPFLAKLDSNENYIWGIVLPGAGTSFGINDIAVDSSDNVYVIGTFQAASIDFDPGPATSNLNSGSSSTIFIAKYNASGNYQWAYKIGGTGIEKGYAVEVDNAQNVYFAGSMGSANMDVNPSPAFYNLSTNGLEDILLLKFKPNGTFVWGFNIGKNDVDYCTDLLCDDNANVYLTGRISTTSTLDFNPGAGVNNVAGFVDDAFIAKYDSAGTYIYAHTFGGGAGDETGTALKIFNNTITVAGNTNGSGLAIFLDGNNALQLPNSANYGDNEIFLYRFSTNGAYLNGICFGGSGNETVNDFTIDSDGNFILTGINGVSNDFDPSLGVVSLTTAVADFDNFIASYTSNYAFRYAIGFGSFNTDVSAKIALANNGNVFVGGGLGSLANDFDPTTVVQGVTPHTASTNVFFLAKYMPCNAPPIQPAQLIGAAQFCVNSGALNYSISPISGVSSYTWSLPLGWTGNSITDSIVVYHNNTSGTLSIIANNSCGSSVAQTLTINANALPNVNISTSDSILCIGQNASLIASGASTYVWSTGATNTTEIVSPLINTTYFVTGTDINGCQNTDSLIQIVTTCVGIHETVDFQNQLLLYPNPCGSNLRIAIPPFENTTVVITNYLNQIVFSQILVQPQIDIDTQNWINGCYFVSLKNSVDAKTFKLIKQN